MINDLIVKRKLYKMWLSKLENLLYVVNVGQVDVSNFKILVLPYFGSRLLHLFYFYLYFQLLLLTSI